MTIKLPKVKVTPQYLHNIAPYTNGQHHLTEALKGAADRIAELEQELAAEKEKNRLARKFVESLEMRQYESGPYFLIGVSTDMRAMQELARATLTQAGEDH